MTGKRLYFARHAESVSNAENRFSTRPPGHPLSKNGELQAITLGRNLAGQGIRRILHSPLVRAASTASLVADQFDVRPEVIEVPDLRELDAGILEGRNGDEAMAELAPAWAKWTLEADLGARSAPGGETADEVLARFDRALTHVSLDATLVVSHGGILQLCLPQRAGNLDARYGYVNWLRNCQVVETEMDGDQLSCLRWAGVRISRNGVTRADEPPSNSASADATALPAKS